MRTGLSQAARGAWQQLWPAGEVGRSRRWRLWPAGFAVLLAAADTYVVVVALPSIMGGTGLVLNEFQRATPIISGFMLGYVALMPLLGRLSDLHGRRPLFVACLLIFAVGSLITATSHDAAVVVTGRGIQGVGGGGLVPVTLALVADLWPVEERGLPLGIVGGVQELGSVLGPLYGAVVVSLSGWRTIFWLNLPLSALLAAAFFVRRRGGNAGDAGNGGPRVRPGRFDAVGTGLLALGLAGLMVALWDPSSLANSVTYGNLFVPEIGGPTWSLFTTPLALISLGVLVVFAAWEWWAPASLRPLLPLRRAREGFRGVDLVGACLLGGVLACVVVAFSTQDPAKEVIARSAPIVLPIAAVLAGVLVWRERRAPYPLIRPDVLRARPAWGSMVVNLAIGAALMAALVDVPLFARVTSYPTSQVGAALVLLRFLVAVPIGAVVGGAICRRRSNAGTAAAGMVLAAAAFVPMMTWGTTALVTPLRIGGFSLGITAPDVELVACGLGFGVAVAPVNAAVLGVVESAWHGLASAFTVMARMIGMMIGLSLLTAIGLRKFYESQAKLGTAATLCPTHPTHCPAYTRGTTHGLLGELHTIFGGAAISAGLAAVLALATLRLVQAQRADRARRVPLTSLGERTGVSTP